jgi:hypothetical protein
MEESARESVDSYASLAEQARLHRHQLLNENWNDGQRGPTYQSLFGEESVLRDRASTAEPPIPGENEPQERNISVVIGRQAATEQPPPYAQCPAWMLDVGCQPRMMPGQMMMPGAAPGIAARFARRTSLRIILR